MGVANTGTFTKHLDGDVNKIILTNYGGYPTQYDKIARIQQAPPGGHYKEAQLSGLGALREKPEGTAVVFDTPVEGNEIERTYKTFALGFQITQEMLQDDLQRNFMKMPAELGRSAAYKRETEFFDLFNSGWSGVGDAHTAWDGNEIFEVSARTTLKTGDDMDNAVATGALSLSTFQTALEYGMTAKDSCGRPTALKPAILLIHPNNYWLAKKFQLNEYEAETGESDINTVGDEGWKYMVSPHITNSDSWFVIFKEHDFRFFWKYNIKVQSRDDLSTGNLMYKASMRFTTFCNDPIGVYGSLGA